MGGEVWGEECGGDVRVERCGGRGVEGGVWREGCGGRGVGGEKKWRGRYVGVDVRVEINKLSEISELR